MNTKIIFFSILASLAASAASAEESADWNTVQLLNAYALDSQLTVQVTVYDVVGEGLGQVDTSEMGFAISTSESFQLCSYVEPLGDFLPPSFFGSSVVKDGFELSFSLSACSFMYGDPELPATLSLYCPPGSITHTDSDAMSKTTFPGRTHRFETVKKNGYKGIGDERTSMCTVTYSSAETVIALPVYNLEIEDSRSRLK